MPQVYEWSYAATPPIPLRGVDSDNYYLAKVTNGHFSKFNSETLHEKHYTVCTKYLTCPSRIVLASAIWMKIIKSPRTHVTPCFISETTQRIYMESGIWAHTS